MVGQFCLVTWRIRHAERACHPGGVGDLGPVWGCDPGSRGVVRALAALSGSPTYVQYANNPPPCDRTHHAPLPDPDHNSTQALGVAAVGVQRVGSLALTGAQETVDLGEVYADRGAACDAADGRLVRLETR